MEYFQKTALGKFISALTEGERQKLFECYITDFIVLTIGVSSQEELQVRGCKPFGWGEECDACECVFLNESCLGENAPLRQPKSRGTPEQTTGH